MRVADTSVLYAAFSVEDAHHDRARRDLEDPTPVLLPTEILAETIDLIAYRFGRPAARAALRALLSLPHVRIAERVAIEPVRTVYESNPSLSLADAFVVQTCRATGGTPLTYDARLRRAST